MCPAEVKTGPGPRALCEDLGKATQPGGIVDAALNESRQKRFYLHGLRGTRLSVELTGPLCIVSEKCLRD